jgi:hypothetical protein
MEANAIALQHVTGEGLREAFGGLIGKADKDALGFYGSAFPFTLAGF